MGIENPAYLIVGDNDAGPEEEQLESIEDLRPSGGKGARVTLRLPPRLVQYLAGLAASNGRSFAAECQAALEVHEALSRLSALLDQELQEERKRASGGLHGVTGRSAQRASRVIRDDVDRIWTQSFATRAQKRQLSDLLLRNPEERS